MPFSDPRLYIAVGFLLLYAITFGGLTLAIHRLKKQPRRAARKDS